MSEQNETKSIHPTISRDFQEIFNAVEGLLANHLNTPSLILLYSAIDIAAGLASPEPGPTGQKHFVGLGCTVHESQGQAFMHAS